jgi:hypothetical protein
MHMQVGKKVLKALQKHARVTCGYAAVKVISGNCREGEIAEMSSLNV